MFRKKAQYVLGVETITRLKALALLSNKNQSETLTGLIDEEWERQGLADLFPKSISQNQTGRGE